MKKSENSLKKLINISIYLDVFMKNSYDAENFL